MTRVPNHHTYSQSVIARFWAKVDRRGEDECWPWLASTRPSGYGRFAIGMGRATSAHRFSFEVHRGPIPAGMFVCHHCDNPPCVNPAHLFVGTPRDNSRDAARKGRCAPQRRPEMYRGERQHSAKLSEADVVEIRRLFAGGAGVSELAQAFGVNSSAIYRVVRWKAWRHVPSERTESVRTRRALSEAEVLSIRERCFQGASFQKVTDEVGLDPKTVGLLARGKTYQQYGGPISPRRRKRHLAPDQVAELRARYAEGNITQKALAPHFGLSESMVQKIVSGRAWRNAAKRAARRAAKQAAA